MQYMMFQHRVSVKHNGQSKKIAEGKQHTVFDNPVRCQPQPTSGGYQSRKEYHYNSPSSKLPVNAPFTTYNLGTINDSST